MDVVNAILKPVVDILMVPVKENLGYMIYYRKYVVDMHKKTPELNDARLGVEDKKKQNNERCLEVPAEVSPWLEEVRQITDKLEALPSNAVLGCLELKSRRKLGREAFEISKTIQDVLQRRPQFPEIERRIPLGRIDSTTATASSSDHHNNEIQSRVQTYNKALELLSRPDHEHHLVALWGMGGVGKTTMMEKLRQTVVEKRMFSYIARLVIGQNLDVKAIQDSIALYLGIELNDKEPKEVRVDQLLQGYKARLGEDKKTFLVILDDVWRAVDLEDIGLNRLQNQGVDFKVLITSRDQAVCTEMGVKADSILKVSLLDEAEAQSLFRQFLEPYSTGDVELEEKLVRKCCGLPIAIKTMACTLRGKSNDTWKNALSSLQPDDINTVFTTSYHNLQNEATKSIFLLCGLFPEDFDIRTEDLLRYGWGLNLFKGKDAIIEARYMLNTCIERLIHTNLLINSDEVGCVKMHDLVRDFVLVMFSKVEHASIVNHDSKPDWPETENDIRASCKRISLTCEAMSEFSHDLKFPNLMILKLMDGDESLMFPRNFYEEMRKLQVISYDYMRNTWLPSSLDECSTKLRVLRLHRCSLTFDLSSIGNLANLEVLSFAKSNIKSLPSTIGQLKKLRLLDVTGCGGLRIDNGVFKNLVKLEELYAKIANGGEPSITFTGDNCNEVAERWNNFCALEFEFIENNAQWKNLSVEKLKLFTISVGCSFDIDWVRSMHSFRNTLKLVTKKGELLQYKINELFKKTEVLCLSMNDTKDLKDIGVNPSSFRNIRVLVFSNCKELGYLFTLDVAKVLSYLEQLRVDNCCVMKELIHVEIGGEETITFPKLKILSLFELPKLLGFCQNVNISIALPQLVKLHMKDILNITSIICSKNKSATSCLLRGEEVLIPKLEILYVEQMDNLEEIWPCDFVMREEGRLKKIKVSDCDKLVNLFPCNPMPLLHNLEELEVIYCGSIKALFNIDLDCVGETGEGGSNSLRSIEVYELEKLEEVWRIKGANHSRIPIRGFRKIDVGRCDNLVNLFPCNPMPLLHNLEELKVKYCGSIKALFNIDLDCVGETGEGGSNSLRSIEVYELEKLEEVWRIKGANHSRIPIRGFRKIDVGRCDNLVNLFPCNPMPLLHNLEELKVKYCGSIKALFNIDLDCVGETGEGGSNSLRSIEVYELEKLEEVWRIKGANHSRIPIRGFRKIDVGRCDNLVNLFPCNPMPLLHNLEELEVKYCGSIKALFNIDLDCVGETGEGGSNSLRSIKVYELEKLEEVWRIKGANHSRIPIRGFRKIDVGRCDNLVNLFPCNPMPLLHNLEVLKVGECGSIEALFNIDLDCVGETGESGSSSSLRSIVVEKLEKLEEVWRIKGANHSRIPIRGFQAVERIRIRECKRFRNVFSPTTTNFDMGAVTYMDISDSGEIGREYGLMESSQGQENTLFPAYLIHCFHNLRNLVLKKYEGVEVIFEIKSTTPTSRDHQQQILPYLEYIKIHHMQKMSHVWKCNWNEYFLIPQKQLPSESPFHNLTNIYLYYCKSIKYLFSPLMAKLLSNLKNIEIIGCDGMEEVVSNRDDIEDEEKIASTSTSTHTISTTLFPLLDYLRLYNLPILKCVGGDNGAQGGNNEISFNGSNTSFIDQYKFSGVDGVSWTLCQYPRELRITKCNALLCVIPWYAAGQMHKLQELYIIDCKVMKEVFETQGISNSSVIITMKLGNLKKLKIVDCGLLEHIFTFSTFETLVQLEELYIGSCKGIKVIVVKEEDDGEQATRASSSYKIVSRLKSIVLADLPELVGFFLGTDIEFQWPSLDEVGIYRCPRMKVFTAGGSTAPQLKYVETELGKHSPTNAWSNSHMTTTTTGQHLESTNSWYPAATSEGTNVLSFHNLVELCIRYETDEKAVVPSNELLHLKKLEKIDLRNHGIVEKVFEEPEAGTNSTTAFDESPTVVNLPNLRQVDLAYLDELRYLWKSNRWTIFEFPNLTTVCIEECDKLEHVFTSSMLGSLNQLQDLSITRCKQMEEVIVEDENNIFLEKEESDDGKTKEIVLPRLKSLKLIRLPGLKGFCLSKVDFSFPLLETLTIRYCPSITTFTKGNLSTPKLIKENEDQDY